MCLRAKKRVQVFLGESGVFFAKVLAISLK